MILSDGVDFNWQVRHEVAQEMRGGPSKSACRSRLQTTSSCSGKESGWWALKEKAWQKTMSGEVQGDERKRTIDEVSKWKGWRQNWGLTKLQDKSKSYLFTAWAASGIKLAWTWTRLLCGTWEPVASMLREKFKWDDPMRVRVPMRGTGTDQLVVAGKSL